MGLDHGQRRAQFVGRVVGEAAFPVDSAPHPFHTAENAKTLATGRPKPLGDTGAKPLARIPAVQAKLDANEKLMGEGGLQATPAVVWRDAAGFVQMQNRAPEGALSEILGPR